MGTRVVFGIRRGTGSCVNVYVNGSVQDESVYVNVDVDRKQTDM